MPRRGENIRKRKDKYSYWEGRYIEQYDINGKAKYKSIYGKSYKEVKETLKDITKLKNLSNNSITIKELCLLWLSTIRIKEKPSTYAKYYDDIYNHIIPYIGNIQVKKINKPLIDKLISEQYKNGRANKQGGLSSKTINDLASLIQQIIKYADNELHLVNSNFQISKPKIEKKEISVLDKEKQNILINYLLMDSDYIKLGCLLSLFMGLRIGELCALTLKDIDFNNQIIHINKTMRRIKNLDKNATTKTKIIIDTPKSIKSNRKIPIPTFLIDIMNNLYNQIPPNAYLLTGMANKYIEPRTLQYKYKAIFKNCNIEYKNFHVLRHTFATNSIESGTDTKTLSELLGHSNVNLTLNIYVHSNMDIKKQSIENTAQSYLG